MRPIVRSAPGAAVVRVLAVLTLLATATVPVGAHDPGSPVSETGLGFGVAVALAVVLGVLGGAVVVRHYRSRTAGHPSPLWVGLLSIGLGGWAAVVAVLRGPRLAIVVVAGAVAAWSLRNHVVVGHRGCDQAALGAVLLHRFVEGALLATLYSADAAVGIGAALALGAHAAVETGAVAGLWATGSRRRGWAVVAVIQTGFVAGAFAGGLVVRSVTPPTSVIALALLGGVLVAAGVATASSGQHATPA